MRRFFAFSAIGAVIAGLTIAGVVMLHHSRLRRQIPITEIEYDWIEVSGEGRNLQFPKSFGGNLVKILALFEQKPSRIGSIEARAEPDLCVSFLKHGKVVRQFGVYRFAVPLMCTDGTTIKLQEQNLADLSAAMRSVCQDPVVLKAVVAEGTASQRIVAAARLLEIKKEIDIANEVLRAEVANPDKSAAKRAIGWCGSFRISDPIIVAKICTALRDNDLKESALVAVLNIGLPAKEASSALIDWFADPEQKFDRPTILSAMSAVDPLSKDCEKLYVACLLDQEEAMETQIAAVEAIGRIGRNGIKHVPLLKKIVAKGKASDRLQSLQFAAVRAVSQIQPDHQELVSWLCEILSDPRFEVNVLRGSSVVQVRGAIEMLGKIGPRAAGALPLIQNHRDDSAERHFQAVVAEAIRRIEAR